MFTLLVASRLLDGHDTTVGEPAVQAAAAPGHIGNVGYDRNHFHRPCNKAVVQQGQLVRADNSAVAL